MSSIIHREKAILVTGAHRSGTTWVGKMLTASGEAAYISEPFNRWRRPGVFPAPVRHWYTYVSSFNEAVFYAHFHELLNFKYYLGKEIRSLHSLKDMMRMGRDAMTFYSGRIKNLIPLVKDPFAFFSSPWISHRFGCQVVITVRHPAAVASSLKRLSWPFDFNDLLDQPELVRDWIEPYIPEMQAQLVRPDDIIGQSCLLWNIIYSVGAQFRRIFPDFLMVKHEDLSLDPISGYRTLYQDLGLNFTLHAGRFISQSSETGNPSEISPKDIYGTRLDSKANLSNWKHRLSVEEIRYIRHQTEAVASEYYSDEDWG